MQSNESNFPKQSTEFSSGTIEILKLDLKKFISKLNSSTQDSSETWEIVNHFSRRIWSLNFYYENSSISLLLNEHRMVDIYELSDQLFSSVFTGDNSVSDVYHSLVEIRRILEFICKSESSQEDRHRKVNELMPRLYKIEDERMYNGKFVPVGYTRGDIPGFDC